ncbi:general odorant-binding protein 56d-like isoform X2 [Culicoides brevitarsis]|uniref:general odorant-binding protein 56d-like isoform X2 n=1 Tax=Culicoides brevitarsis TaxID=469753 RepID=UPI00307CB113
MKSRPFLCCTIFVLGVLQFSPVAPTTLEEDAENECKDQFAVTAKQLSQLHNRDFESIDPVDERVQCFVKCFFQKAKWVDATGSLNRTQMEADVPTDVRHEISQIVQRCTPLQGQTACETAFKQTKCFVVEYKKVEKEYAAKFTDDSAQHL